MSDYGISGRDATCSLEELVALLRKSCETITRFQGGDTFYQEEIEVFKNIAQQKGLFLKEPPAVCSTPPSDAGNEHQVWHLPDEGLFLKATWPNCFGMRVIYRPHEERLASPIEYLERWLISNQIFGDSVDFLGVIEEASGMRLIITQPAIVGEPATEDEINDFFLSKAWSKLEIEGNTAYVDFEQAIAISDTHRGNIIALKSGLLLPIDLRVQKLSDSLLDTARQLNTDEK